ncbi:small glutamine-rich tetratricopeptide repeat-containing protein beta [Zeugodacus cucurbitae]|uniref:Small glutamine-rich tetratricopeptide repeat-containing protein alpha n=1 Tax=Zeugodacus cucurbitae TaxID=28588 RepID=A0A0A1XB60_ZEUCU|nr:small glutamine-rich tetratricopeptide repeat-containing protein beta [Zeugodacus cucurbitae]
MVDPVQKEFVQAFINFLKNPSTSQNLSSDCRESVDVAIQCLQSAFDISDDVGLQSVAGTQESDDSVNKDGIDMFEIFQSLFIERNPKATQMAESFKNEGNRLMKEGKYNEAMLQYNRAICFDPRNAIYYCNRAAAYIRLNYNENAVTDCKTALLYNPTYGKAYGRLGIAYSNLKKYLESQQAYEKAIELEPENQDYRNNLQVAREAAQLRDSVPQISESINSVLSSQAIRNLVNDADIDFGQLQALSQDPVVRNTIQQLCSGMPTNSNDPMASPLLPNSMIQLFQSIASQFAAAQGNGSSNDSSSSHTDTRPPAV